MVVQRRLNPNLYTGYKPTRFRRRSARFQGIPSHITSQRLDGIDGCCGLLGTVAPTALTGQLFAGALQIGGQLWGKSIEAGVVKKQIGADKAVGLATVGGQTAIGLERAKTDAILGVHQSQQISKTEPYKWAALAAAALGVAYIIGRKL